MLTRWGLHLSIGVICTASLALAQSEGKPPETFTATAQALGKDVGAAASLTIHISAYTDERNRTAVQEALQTGGYQGFLPALRKAPDVGYVEVGGRKVTVRWARQVPTQKGRTITIVTERPIFFVGGGSVDAKPREGFDVAVIQLDVDSIGLGTGSLAAAARVRPGGPSGVQIDDYAEQPVKLATVRKSYAK